MKFVPTGVFTQMDYESDGTPHIGGERRENYLRVLRPDMEYRTRRVCTGYTTSKVLTQELFHCQTQSWNLRLLELIIGNAELTEGGHSEIPQDHPPYLVEVWEPNASVNLYAAPIATLSGAMSVIQTYLELASW